ncbi:MAG: triose-phosphate isomerase [Alphaproteobacteria bacterium]|uniref:triose-phosphate isomerase n=1 Tax=Brevundimonas sp. TaxID=1871086 RepID=UPI0035661676|nr:triose-phosphate isomerase [Alphaproteobacteria bacterium]MBU1521287.1 triose-phosphate isomerase [Alphaproteobacteria bacterium]MBU2031092.1 triose-phosphate isomerase [Alphaproteobacteria bacterium]MBU2164003.1 triose-phosphate isomerase [Alphaproteobacteria bacterium]MBU2230299.1 triose-phosphate isomerase [Alphaproteobacteria bacterium]
MKQSVKLIVGNWKMHGVSADVSEALALKEGLAGAPPACRIALCPPATLTDRLRRVLADSAVEVGGQDCHEKASGAFTGSVSADMLADAGATLVILGHSERRAAFGETDADVAAKVEAAMAAGLEPIVCVGETLEQHEAGQAVAVVSAQIAGSLPDGLSERDFAVAYEPVWAIGTGLTPTLDQIAEVHAAIRTAMIQRLGEPARRAPILYGGSVKPDNAAEILAVPEVGGALVGGASLKADDFLKIVRAV